MFNYQNEINFLFEIGTLRNISRTWNEFFGKEVANVAEHTIRVSWIAIILAKHESIENIEHILKLALIHDVSEIRSVDVNYLSRQYVIRNEEKAINDTFEKVNIGEEFYLLWKEMEGKKTIEAKIVKDADNLDVDLEIVEKIFQGNELRKILKKDRLELVNDKLFTKTAKEMQKEIYESNPHNWHLLSESNRFKGGDFKK